MAQVAKSQVHLRRMLVAALFVALAYVSRFIFHFNVAFLTFECKDAFLAIGGMFLGPLWALGMSAATALIEFITISDTGWYGLVMNFCAAAAFACVASLVYRYRRTLTGAIVGLSAGVAALVGVMLPLNLLITPAYMGVGIAEVIAILPKLLLPFNLLKGILNMAVVLLLYKPLTRALRATHLAQEMQIPSRAAMPAETAEVTETTEATETTDMAEATKTTDMTKSTSASQCTDGKAEGQTPRSRLRHRLLAPLLGAVLLIAALLVFFLALHGKVTVGK